MSKQKIVGYAAFARWELDLARGKARGLIGNYGFTESDLKDIEQEMLLQVYLKRGTRGSWAEVTASERTVMSRILNNRIRDIIDVVKTKKRKFQTNAESLHRKLSTSGDDEDTLTLEETLSEEQSFSRQGGITLKQEEEIRLALARSLEKLTDIQRRVCDLVLKGLNITQVATTLGVRRKKVHKELSRMRSVFDRDGLGEYI